MVQTWCAFLKETFLVKEPAHTSLHPICCGLHCILNAHDCNNTNTNSVLTDHFEIHLFLTCRTLKLFSGMHLIFFPSWASTRQRRLLKQNNEMYE